MQRNKRSESGKTKQRIEQQCNAPTHQRHGGKGCWNTLGSVMKMREGPLSGFTPTLNAAGNIISPARTAITVSMTEICTADFSRLVCRLK